MPSRELDILAALHVPGTGPPEIHPLRQGLINDTYRVVRDGRAYALRVAASNPCDLGLDRAWEARVLERAARWGFAPGLEYCDPQRGILVARWADGRPWSPSEARLPSNILRMAGLIRRIHALPMPTSPRVMSPSTWIDYYTAAIGGGVGAGPGAAAVLRSEAAVRLAAYAALPSARPVLCHSDLHTLNLIDSGQALVLIDWEYAHASDPLWDLAGWSANNDFEDELRQELLSAYYGRPPTADECRRLCLLDWLFDYIALLWSELYLIQQRGNRPDAAAQGGVPARALLLASRLGASK